MFLKSTSSFMAMKVTFGHRKWAPGTEALSEEGEVAVTHSVTHDNQCGMFQVSRNE